MVWRQRALAALLLSGASVAVAQEAATPGGRPVYFVRDIAPIFDRMLCSTGACHGRFSGQGQFKLSLMTLSPVTDFTGLEPFVDLKEPEKSRLLQKPTGQVSHGGGRRFKLDSAEYQTMLAWIKQGCRNPQRESLPVKLAVSPERFVFGPDSNSGLVKVTATFADGSTEDVTSRTRYISQDDNVASCDPTGKIKAQHWGMTAVICRYAGLTRAAYVSMPRPSDDKDGPKPKLSPINIIDSLVFKGAEWLNLHPSGPSDDYKFLRRVNLDLVASLPEPAEIRTFVADPDPDKREKLVDKLLADPRFDNYRSLRLGDLLRIKPNKLDGGPMQTRAAMMFDIWVREQVAANRPWNEFVHEMVTATGSTMQDGPANFYRVERAPQDRAETVGQAFLAVRLACARCHNHPFDRWTTDDYWQFAAFMAKVKERNGELSGEGLVYHDEKATLVNKSVVSVNKDKVALPALLGENPIEPATFKGRYIPTLADWMTDRKNAYFGIAAVNRTWAYLFGKGIVNPVDDIRNTSVPSVPALLQVLAGEFANHGYDMKWLYRTICTSRTYQLDSTPNSTNALDDRFFTRYLPKQMIAQVMLDALNKACGTNDQFGTFPAGTRAVDVPLYMGNDFLDKFGRSSREFLADLDPHAEPTLPQTLAMINSGYINGKVAAGNGTVAQLEPKFKDDPALITELYLRTLCRPPTADEVARVVAGVKQAPTRREGYEDLLWALVTCREFTFVS